MNFTSIKIAGAEAIRLLDEYRSRYRASGQFPFLIGDSEELERIKETAAFNRQDPAAIIKASLDVTIADWIAARLKEVEEDGLAPDETAGEWPGGVIEKASIDLHKDILTGEIKPEVYLGMAPVEEPWHLPAVLKYGCWNDCPESEVHCAFHREWYAEYGAEIAGISGDVIECIVARPPSDREAALRLAWQQYRYCMDIVEQSCGSVSNLAATLLDSRYWYFWWD